MRTYYIYYRKASVYSNGHFYAKRWQPWQLVAIVEGPKQLYELFKKMEKYNFIRPLHFVMKWDNLIFMEREGVEEERFLIIDDKERFRNYWELTSHYRKKKKHRFKHHPYQMRSIHIANDKRQSLTPQCLKDIRKMYGFYFSEIKGKRKIYSYYNYKYIGRISRKSRSWKDQSKRKRQYK